MEFFKNSIFKQLLERSNSAVLEAIALQEMQLLLKKQTITQVCDFNNQHLQKLSDFIEQHNNKMLSIEQMLYQK